VQLEVEKNDEILELDLNKAWPNPSVVDFEDQARQTKSSGKPFITVIEE